MTLHTLQVRLSDAEIRRQAAGQVVTLRDPRHPALRFRFHRDRAVGSWFVVLGGTWRKVGSYPALTFSALVAVLPEVIARLTADPAASSVAGGLETLDQVLEWQLERQLRNRALSAKRKVSVKSMIRRHLVPRLRGVRVANADKATLDRLLFWPLQEEFSVGYVRQAYGVLMAALRQAHRLDLITANPMGSMRFTDFVRSKILPRSARLRPEGLSLLLANLQASYREQPEVTMLALLMLCHGTRLGETRTARWRDFALVDAVWTIPADVTKTRTEHQLPLTDQVLSLLRAHRAHQQARGVDSVFLFPGTRGQSISANQATLIFSDLSAGDWTSHDLRKLARTCWTEIGIDHLIGEMLLNHVLRGVLAAYIQTQARERKREALERWHAHLDRHGFTAIHGETEPGCAAQQNTGNSRDTAAESTFQVL
ncbi:integrase [Pseudomonas aeruginosa]|uniref:tyrosine-type recombinase/integrase n=1 Tax=Pseudomonas aeruginosa TaxID=287 RepID=UPI00071BC423|nr:site-specific integrase [Pseudomonas aeruginosa]KSL10691.1 integrase [Pseudomonas aeruginosa]